MADATFDFPFHKVQTTYPQEGQNLKLGNSWDYNSKPSSPTQRTFELSFKVLKYFASNGILDLNTEAKINLGALEAFYQAHKQHTKFTYPHPVYGNVSVKFSKPLVIPEGVEGGGGAVAGVGVVLIEIPA